jgi:molybdenum cofactor cytidylyltransferase
MISGIVLAAGLSQRFGSPKALAPLNTTTVIEHLQQSLIDSKLGEIIVVLGADADSIRSHVLKHNKVSHVYNKDYILGQTSSFQAGLQEISPDARGVMLLPVDFPLIKTETVDLLIEEFMAGTPPILIPVHNGHRGHPPVFNADLKGSLLAMDPKMGLNVFEHQHAPEVSLLPMADESILQTFNTPVEFKVLKQKL